VASNSLVEIQLSLVGYLWCLSGLGLLIVETAGSLDPVEISGVSFHRVSLLTLVSARGDPCTNVNSSQR